MATAYNITKEMFEDVIAQFETLEKMNYNDNVTVDMKISPDVSVKFSKPIKSEDWITSITVQERNSINYFDR